MKHKLSVTLNEELVNDVITAISTGKFRNKSHLIEYAVKQFLKEEEQDG